MPYGLIGFATWLALFAAAGIVFPRRPAVSGFLFLSLGVWSMVLRYASANPFPPPAPVLLGVGAIWFAIGVRQVLRHSHQ